MLPTLTLALSALIVIVAPTMSVLTAIGATPVRGSLNEIIAALAEVAPTMQAPMHIVGTNSCFIFIAASSLLSLNIQTGWQSCLSGSASHRYAVARRTIKGRLPYRCVTLRQLVELLRLNSLEPRFLNWLASTLRMRGLTDKSVRGRLTDVQAQTVGSEKSWTELRCRKRGESDERRAGLSTAQPPKKGGGEGLGVRGPRGRDPR